MAVSLHSRRDAKLLVHGIHAYAEINVMGYAYVHVQNYLNVCSGRGGRK